MNSGWAFDPADSYDIDGHNAPVNASPNSGGSTDGAGGGDEPEAPKPPAPEDPKTPDSPAPGGGGGAGGGSGGSGTSGDPKWEEYYDPKTKKFVKVKDVPHVEPEPTEPEPADNPPSEDRSNDDPNGAEQPEEDPKQDQADTEDYTPAEPVFGNVDADQLGSELKLQTDSLILKVEPGAPATSTEVGADVVGEMADTMSQILFDVVSNPSPDSGTYDEDQDGLYDDVIENAKEFISEGIKCGLTLSTDHDLVDDPDENGSGVVDQFDYL